MSEELKTNEVSKNEPMKSPGAELSEEKSITPKSEPVATKLPSAEREQITNEKELSREQKTAVKKLKDYSHEAKKRSNAKQNEQTEADTNSERAVATKLPSAEREQNEDEREEIKTEKSETSINTFLAFSGVLIALAGLYLAHKNYLTNQIKAGVHDDMIKIQPTPQQTQKKNPKFRTL